MKRTIFGLVVGAALVFGGNAAYDQWRLGSIQSQPPENWLKITLDIADAGIGENPVAHARYQILRPVIIRTNISPRNLDTGQSLCQGRITTTYDSATDVQEMDIPIPALAGLKNCDWPAGRYSASITFTMTDLDTSVQVKPLAMEREFTVTR